MSDPTASVTAHNAVVAFGARPVHISPIGLARVPLAGSDFATVIYDLAPWTDEVVPLVRALRRAYRTLSLLLYAPPIPSVPVLTYRCSGLRAVKTLLQSASSSEPETVRDGVAWLMAARHAEVVCHFVELLIPDLPARARDCMRRTLDHLVDPGRLHIPSVHSIATQLGVPERTLQRNFESAGLPSPKAVMDWITLMFLTLAAESNGRSMSAVAGEFGIDRYTVRRLRQRLLHVDNGSGPGGFNFAFLGFAEACHVSSSIALRLITPAG
ncbi:MAG: hypothetical protein ACE5HT_04715 [Gemmatimonadales bacterium]